MPGPTPPKTGRLGRRLGIALFAALVSVPTAVWSFQIMRVVWSPSRGPEPASCRTGQLDLLRAVERARSAAAGLADVKSVVAPQPAIKRVQLQALAAPARDLGTRRRGLIAGARRRRLARIAGRILDDGLGHGLGEVAVGLRARLLQHALHDIFSCVRRRLLRARACRGRSERDAQTQADRRALVAAYNTHVRPYSFSRARTVNSSSAMSVLTAICSSSSSVVCFCW